MPRCRTRPEKGRWVGGTLTLFFLKFYCDIYIMGCVKDIKSLCYVNNISLTVEKPCPVLLAEAQEGGILIGEFVPRCEVDGSYSEMQCHGSTGYCWCVDSKTGVKHLGTDIRGRPDCSGNQMSSFFLSLSIFIYIWRHVKYKKMYNIF